MSTKELVYFKTNKDKYSSLFPSCSSFGLISLIFRNKLIPLAAKALWILLDENRIITFTADDILKISPRDRKESIEAAIQVLIELKVVETEKD
jgi:hypothetical protein